MQERLILSVSRLKNWDLCTLTLLVVREEGGVIKVAGAADEEDANSLETKALLRICRSLSEEELFNTFGKKAFRKPEKFWKEADNAMKRYVRRVVDKRIMNGIRHAQALHLPIFLRTARREMTQDEALMMADEEAVPMMSFERTESGIIYRLRLSMKDKTVNIRQLKPEILTNTPGLIVTKREEGVGMMLHTLGEDFSALLLRPFIEKDEIFIPKRAEKEYFQKFILKNIRKTEIEAIGFDIVEKETNRGLLVCVEQTFTHKTAIILRFRYAHLTFGENSNQRCSVTLEEADDSFRFVRICRDSVWEQGMKERFCQLDDAWPKDDEGSVADTRFFDNNVDAIRWLCQHKADIDQLGQTTIWQSSIREYYIGTFRILQSKMWITDWLHLHIQIKFENGTTVPFLYFRHAILAGEEEVELPDGKIFIIPTEWFAEYGGMLMVAGSRGDAIVLHRTQLASLSPSISDMEDELALITNVQEEESCPKQLKTTLRPYQRFGFHWLLHNFAATCGCCLADDMGLGKTVQTIALLLKYKEESLNNKKVRTTAARKDQGRQLQIEDLFSDFFADNQQNSSPKKEELCHPYRTNIILCPSSLVFNWRNELKRFAPSLSVCEYTGTLANRMRKQECLMQWDVVIMGYRTAVNDIEWLSTGEFGIAVFDESQTFKNRSSQVYQAIQRIKAIQRIALSGTPMENNLPELWSLMNVLNPNLLGDFKTFQQNFINPIKESLEDMRTQILRRTIAPFFLGRRKEDVLTDLPSRQDEIVLCKMGEEQEYRYEKELSAARNTVLCSVPDLDEALSTGHCQSGQLNVLAAIGRLRQTASDPRLTGFDTPSAKTETVLMKLAALHGSGHKVLIFSEYVSYLELIASEMEQRKWGYSLLTGETQHRERIVNHFESSAEHQFFLISLKAGGVGLNLTSADYIFLLNPWWNLAVEEQAISRAYRIGQERKVFVYRFITQGTIEEQILALQDRKKNLVDAVLPFLANKQT
ncbi:MAG: DEAD/DEAH box helicase [Bacteroidales bacterium]|nr:DEAD/DEAH box helicase [Candidatus Physcousia equi]